jgi:hypothetical protein
LSAESWRLTLDGATWRLRRGPTEFVAPAGADPALALTGLCDRAAVRGGRLAVELADAWLRYLVIDWPVGLKGGDERQAWVAERFRSVHGVNAIDWVISVDRAAAGRSVLACAAPRALVEALTRFAADHRLRFVSLTGSFVATYNTLHGGAALAADAEPLGALGLRRDGRLTLGLWSRGQWRRVRSVAAGADAGQILGRTLAGWLPGLSVAAGEGKGVRSGEVFAPGVLHLLGIGIEPEEAEALPGNWRLQVIGDVA